MDGNLEIKPTVKNTANINFLDFVSDTAVPRNNSQNKTPLSEFDGPKNYLEKGVDTAVSLVVSDPQWRNEIDHYGANFLTTASLFARGRAGWIGTGLLYGLANTNPNSSFSEKLQDFTLGAAKGESVRGLYHVLGNTGQFAPTKGILMGLASRGAEDIFQRDLFTDPSKALGRLQAEANNKTAMAYDALVWTLGEGVFTGANAMTGGAFARNRYAGAMFMGGTFGAINGGGGEIMRQQATGEATIDWRQVLTRGLIQGGLDAGAAGVGMGVTDPALHSRISQLWQKKVAQPVSLDVAATVAGAERSADGKDSPDIARARELGRPGNVRLVGPDGQEVSLTTMAKINLSRAPGVAGPQIHGGDTTISVMAPLVVGDPTNPEGEGSKAAWAEFDRQLAESKKLGIHSVSTDVWWGLVEAKEGQFNWRYYDKMAEHITQAGLKWTPILSFHQCGGNVGDNNVFVPVPNWVWEKLATKVAGGDAIAAQYVSEQGHASKEYVSAWATDLVLDNYAGVMREFRSHFANRAGGISEINISLGPAGELRYPSYNSHDKDTGYPTRGALQAYSELARQSFRDFALKKYGGLEGVRQAWKLADLTVDKINPPDNANEFFNHKDHENLQYGRDFFDWYSDSLISHGRKVLGAAVNVFGEQGSPFMGVDIGAKVPGVHWYVGERNGDAVVLSGRLAELTAGLIRTSQNDWGSDASGRGYRPILSMFQDFQPLRPGMGNRVVPAMTALELPDGQDGAQAQSIPHTLATWVGQEAKRLHVPLNGENALSFTLQDAASWDRMHSLLILPTQPNGYYSSLMLLRMGDVVNDPIARAKVSEIINAVRSIPKPAVVPAAETPKPPLANAS